MNNTTNSGDRTAPSTGPSIARAGEPSSAREDFQRTYAETHTQAVAVPTRACRLRYARPHTDGTPAAAEPIDFADFLASVLAGVAANLGSVDRVTAGRSGSWEAGLVEQLLARTVGADESWLFEHRTEPVVVPLNVPALVWDLAGAFPDVEAAVEAAEQPYLDATDPAVTLAWTDAHWDELDAAREATEDVIREAYAEVYRRYADAFTVAVQAAAAQVPGLSVPVTVTAVHDPRTPFTVRDGVQNPIDDYGLGVIDRPVDDRLVTRLWQTALDAVPTPPPPVVALPALPAWLTDTQPPTTPAPAVEEPADLEERK